MEEFDPRSYIRITNGTGELLVWENRPFWLMPSKCDIAYPSGSTQMRTARPTFFVEVDSVGANVKTAESFNAIFKARDLEADWPKTEAESPIKWRTVVASTFARITNDYRRDFCNGPLGYEAHCYHEHPAAADGTALAMAVDFAQERDEFDDKPSGPLCVLHYDAMGAPGWGMPAVGLFSKLPHWKVKAPASLMMRATRPPRVSVNTFGTGPRLVTQLAYRKGDVDSVFEFLRLPGYVYTRQVHSRHVPGDYRREAFKQGTLDRDARSSALGDGSE